jgi:MraZ protein
MRRRLIGRTEQAIDPKGRLVLPSNHRERYLDGAILSLRGNHLAVYEPEAWDEFVDKLSARLESGEVPRQVFNQIAGDAVDLRPDSAGRILIPQSMRSEIGLDREVVVQGAITYLAIYPKGAETSKDVETRTQARELVDAIGI